MHIVTKQQLLLYFVPPFVTLDLQGVHKKCFFSKILKYIPDSGLSQFPLGVSVCTQWQVKHQHCSRTCRVHKNHNILRRNTISNEHPVSKKNRVNRYRGLTSSATVM